MHTRMENLHSEKAAKLHIHWPRVLSEINSNVMPERLRLMFLSLSTTIILDIIKIFYAYSFFH